MSTPLGATSRTTDPVPVSWQKMAALSGIAFAVLFVLTVILSSGTTPDIGDPAADWNTFAADNQDKSRLAMIPMALAGYAFVLWLGYLRGQLAEAETRVRGFSLMAAWPFAGGIIAITGLALGVFVSALALVFEDNPGEVIRGVHMLTGAGFSLAELGFATMLITTWFCVSATRALPDWLGWVALVGGLAALLTFGTLLAEEGDNFFGIFYPLSWLFLLIFVIGSSFEFNRRLTRGAGVPPEPVVTTPGV